MIVKTGLGASSSSSVMPAVLAGGAILLGLVAVIALGTRERTKTIDDEAEDLFPPPARNTGKWSHVRAYRAAVGRCYYKDMRVERGPEEAAAAATRAVDRAHGWLTQFAKHGRSVRTGCNLLHGHVKMSGKRVASSRATAR